MAIWLVLSSADVLLIASLQQRNHEEAKYSDTMTHLATGIQTGQMRHYTLSKQKLSS